MSTLAAAILLSKVTLRLTLVWFPAASTPVILTLYKPFSNGVMSTVSVITRSTLIFLFLKAIGTTRPSKLVMVSVKSSKLMLSSVKPEKKSGPLVLESSSGSSKLISGLVLSVLICEEYNEVMS